MSIQSVLHIHRKDKWGWLYIPSIILSSSFFVHLIVSLLINNDEAFYTGGITSIFVYAFVMGILVVVQSFPFAIGMSVTRKDYFFGTVLMGLAACFILGALIRIFTSIENRTSGWGNRFHFFYFPYLNDGTSFFQQLIMYVILFSFLFFLGFLIASFARRFGVKGMMILSLAVLLIGSVIVLLFHQFHVWPDIFKWFSNQTAVGLSYRLIPVVLFSMAASYLLLRKVSV
ncbi:hypothetical protein QNH23_18085 [Siminovitchia fortis]|uniref:Uncharacterized protein n=1 Tax=Siminovitchia fortis TaxID=254758 RepID=A0A443IZ93_9BACI|nr:hypothetical protein [Siminovitchia fortis]RWR13511.1 hypothetical protein D4N35_004755 [Siminovitchia fortis]WHY81752.1 hypothetical protein QNH23_18085 [Siminovitchia fortis]